MAFHCIANWTNGFFNLSQFVTAWAGLTRWDRKSQPNHFLIRSETQKSEGLLKALFFSCNKIPCIRFNVYSTVRKNSHCLNNGGLLVTSRNHVHRSPHANSSGDNKPANITTRQIAIVNASTYAGTTCGLIWRSIKGLVGWCFCNSRNNLVSIFNAPK